MAAQFFMGANEGADPVAIGKALCNWEIADALPDHIVVLDSSGSIVATNAAWRRFAAESGADPSKAGVGARYLDICRDPGNIPLPPANDTLSSLGAVMEGRLTEFSCEYPFHTRAEEKWFHMHAVPLSGARGVVISHHNITHRRQLEARDRESRTLLAAVFDDAADPTFLCDAAGVIHLANRAFTKLFALPISEILERNVADFQQPEMARIVLERNAIILATGVTQTFEITPRTASGVRTFEVTKGIHGDWNGQAREIWGSARDVSVARAAERDIVDTSDQERQRMGALLHEGPCQTLSGMWLQANALCDDLFRLGVAQAEDARQVANLAKLASTELKQLLKEFLMIPLPLDEEHGLLTALEYLVEQASADTDTVCRLRLPRRDFFVDPYISTHLYRIAQEAVYNATKHSKASRLDISLCNGRKGIVLSVRDNGTGDPLKPGSSSGIAVQIMNYRARAIGATLDIRKLRSNGTAVICTLPL